MEHSGLRIKSAIGFECDCDGEVKSYADWVQVQSCKHVQPIKSTWWWRGGGEIGQNGKKILVLTARAITITIIIRLQPSIVRSPLTGTLRKLPHLGARRWDFDSCDKTEAWLRCTFAVAPSNDSHLNYVKWPGRRLQAPLNSMCVCVCARVWNLFIC